MKIGVLGAGQLGRMMALAGTPLGHEFAFFDAKADACAASLGPLTVGKLTDLKVLDAFVRDKDIVTYESENTPVESVEHIGQSVPVFPSVEALATSQDRLLEKTLCKKLDIPTAPWAEVDGEEDLRTAVETLGVPCILKTRRMGYDGKGQVRIFSESDLTEAIALLEHGACILEGFVGFDREVSQVSVRTQSGDIRHYALTENVHRDGILVMSSSPAEAQSGIGDKTRAVTAALMERFGYVGTFAVEFFVTTDGEVLVNEMAPRVHNSGHWTIDGAYVSQFENHVRAITGMPLGSVSSCGNSVMLNVIGRYPSVGHWIGMEGVHVHLYGKSERPGRKIGHVTVCHPDDRMRNDGKQAVLDALNEADAFTVRR